MTLMSAGYEACRVGYCHMGSLGVVSFVRVNTHQGIFFLSCRNADMQSGPAVGSRGQGVTGSRDTESPGVRVL